MFSNQVSNYESCWYVFTLVGIRTHGAGRFFVTPQRPLEAENDVGTKRIRIMLVHEQEIRKICTGEIAPDESLLFSERHRARWSMLKCMADMFEKQLSRVALDVDMPHLNSDQLECLSPKTRRKVANHFETRNGCADRDCNNFLRIHVPIPLVKETHMMGPQEVVLFE
jgi:hypothetical protein